jgi:hypothetical protein
MPENVHLPACVKKKNIRKDDANFETICNDGSRRKMRFPAAWELCFLQRMSS